VDFLYPLANFLQPGILWPVLAPFKPMLLLSAICIGYAMISRATTEKRAVSFTHPVFVWACLFVFVQIISVYYSGFGSLFSELDFWNVFPMFMIVSMLLIRDGQSLVRYVWGMLFGSAVVIVTGIVYVFMGKLAAVGNRAGAYGMYENHNDYTFIIIMSLPFAWLLVPTTKGRLRKLFLMAYCAAGAFGALLSLSRGGIIALVLQVGLIIWLTTRGRTRVASIVLVGILGAGVVVHQWIARDENQAGNYSSDDAKNSRFELWRAGAKMIEAHPLLGVGSRRFGEFATDYSEISHDNLGKNAHNTIIEVFATSGVLGITTFIGMIVAILRSVRYRPNMSKRYDALRMATQIAIVSILFRSMFDAKSYDWSYYTLAAIAVALAAIARQETVESAGQEPVPELARMPAEARANARRPNVYGTRALRPR
jgi:O-antigen ligase